MPKAETILSADSLARQLELIAKRFSASDNQSVLDAVKILVAILKPLSVSAAYFSLVVEYMEGLDAFIEERLSAK